MKELQKKVLLFLVGYLEEELSDKSWYEDDVRVPGLSEGDQWAITDKSTGYSSLAELIDLAKFRLTEVL
jgi:hypothetical protein